MGSNTSCTPGQVTSPPPLEHIVNKTPSTHRTKKCLSPPSPRILSGTALIYLDTVYPSVHARYTIRKLDTETTMSKDNLHYCRPGLGAVALLLVVFFSLFPHGGGHVRVYIPVLFFLHRRLRHQTTELYTWRFQVLNGS